MKRTLISLSVVAMLVAAVALSQSKSTHEKNPVLGVWELVSGTYNGQSGNSNGRQIKTITPGRFIWVAYDKSSMKPGGMGVGTCTLNGTSYTEHVEFIDVAGQNVADMIGKDFTFIVKVEGNTLTQSGDLGGIKLSETWKRLE